jgi:hypothetical protein
MAGFKSFKALETYLNNKIRNALQSNDVIEQVKQTMQENILREVYMAYNPRVYQRRGNSGGLMADESITHDVLNSSTIAIYNIAKRNTSYADTTYTNPYLAPLIELGHKEAENKGYQGYNYPFRYLAYFKPRPFIKETRNELARTKKHVKAFQKSLKSLGIDSE